MKYLLEKTDFIYVKLDVEIAIKTILEHTNHSYKMISFNNLVSVQEKEKNAIAEGFTDNYKEYIPIGSIEFVQQFYRGYYGIERENSIEIPKILRDYNFLKRDYRICYYDSLPKIGLFFVKDAIEEKSLSFLGDMRVFHQKYDINADITSHIFVCSEILKSYAEYRFYVVRGSIKHISCYKGDCNRYHNRKLVKNIVCMLNELPRFPKSYSFDVMVTNRGTALLEVHTFCGLGIHNYMWDESLLQAYEDCNYYYLNYNCEIEL